VANHFPSIWQPVLNLPVEAIESNSLEPTFLKSWTVSSPPCSAAAPVTLAATSSPACSAAFRPTSTASPSPAVPHGQRHGQGGFDAVGQAGVGDVGCHVLGAGVLVGGLGHRHRGMPDRVARRLGRPGQRVACLLGGPDGRPLNLLLSQRNSRVSLLSTAPAPESPSFCRPVSSPGSICSSRRTLFGLSSS
jgi:hypothetical protein